MVTRVVRAVYREVHGLHTAAYILALFTFGSQLLALVRDRLLAHQFGAGTELDLYYSAFRIPDLLYVLFASTLSVYVLIPFVAERMQGTDTQRARALLSGIFTLFLIVYSLLALVLAVCAPVVATFFFPGFAAEQEQLVQLIRILLLQPFFLGISSLLSVITQYHHRFVLYAISPILYNIGIIFGVLVLYPFLGITGLVWGVVLGAFAHLMIQLPFVRQSNLAPHLVSHFSLTDIAAVLRVSIPRALTLSLHQFVLLGLIGVASVMAVGSVSVFQFAYNLQSVPLAIIGMSYSVAAFPVLAKLYAEKRFTRFGAQIMTALRHIIFWSLPVVALILVLRAHLVRVILGSGAFDWGDTRLTAAVLALFVLSLTAQAIHLLVVRALYACGNTRLALYMTLLSSVGALTFAFILHTIFTVFPETLRAVDVVMRVEGILGTEVLALPIGYTVALILHSIFLLIYARKELMIRLADLVPDLTRALAASVGAGAAAYGMLNLLVDELETDTLFGIFTQGALAGIVGLASATLIYAATKSPELAEVIRALKSRFQKTEVPAPQDEDRLAV